MSFPKEKINEFWALKRVAIVGVSRTQTDFTRGVFRELKQRGYDVIPVNPQAEEIEGQKCYATVKEIQPPPQGVIIMTPPQVTDKVVQDCSAAGVEKVWMHKGGGLGAVSDSAVKYCQDNGISVIAGYCPYMYLPQTQFFHKAHGFVRKLQS